MIVVAAQSSSGGGAHADSFSRRQSRCFFYGLGYERRKSRGKVFQEGFIMCWDALFCAVFHLFQSSPIATIFGHFYLCCFVWRSIFSRAFFVRFSVQWQKPHTFTFSNSLLGNFFDLLSNRCAKLQSVRVVVAIDFGCCVIVPCLLVCSICW